VSRALKAYLAANAAFLVPGGLQTVLFPWLLVVVLAESPERVGLAQMLTQIPAVVLLLVAGLLGDRFDQRRILIVTSVLVAASPLAIAWLLAAHRLTFDNLIALAVFGSIVGVFSGPPRDAMLSRVAGERIQFTVILVLGLQFLSQIIGYGFALATDLVGGPLLFALAAAMYALGAWPCALLPRGSVNDDERAGGRAAPRHALAEILAGLREAAQSERLRPALILTLALGSFFFGAFLVLLPLIVRDVYHGGASDISLVFGANMIGTVIVIAVLMHRGGVVRQGRAFMLALLFGCVLLSLLAVGPPRSMFLLLSFVWGLGGGFTLTMGRTIVQESAPPEMSARLLSVYALCTSAGMPIGSLAIGYAAQRLGPLVAALLPAIGMATTVVLVGATSRFWHLEAKHSA